MSIADPATAPKRADLPYLRHRSRPAAEATTAAAAPATSHAVAEPARAVADFLHDRGPRRHGGSTPPAASALDLSANPLDLSAPSVAPPAARPAPPAVPDTGNPLDLSAPAPSTVPASTAPAPAPTSPPNRPAPVRYQPRRARAGAPTILSPKDPVVTLNRLQSGVGVLRIEAACSPAVGDLRLGCAYQLRSGQSSVVQHASGVTTAPPNSHRPVIIGQRGQFETLTVDLVQLPEIDRLIIYGFSDSGVTLNWGGTLVLTTFGQARVELPLDRPPSPHVGVLMSIYQLAGELVVRAEMEEIRGSVRDAVSAYGFDRISWLDPRTPLV